MHEIKLRYHSQIFKVYESLSRVHNVPKLLINIEIFKKIAKFLTTSTNIYQYLKPQLEMCSVHNAKRRTKRQEEGVPMIKSFQAPML